MKILLTGGGTGGHFYPIVAVASEIRRLAREHKVFQVELYYMASTPYDASKLEEQKIIFLKTPTGKMRRYASGSNFFDIFKTIFGVFSALWKIFRLYPDVVFGKGGYDSFPALFAARFFRIPVLIHESDSRPGRVNAWAGKFAKRIAVGFPETVEFFEKQKDKVAFTGNPVRAGIAIPQKEGIFEYLNLERDLPVIYIAGGSQGSRTINEHMVDIAPELVKKYQIVHQTGIELEDETKVLLGITLEESEHKDRYHVFPYLNDVALKMIAGVARLIVSRAGAGTISEIATWKLPAILIPLSTEVSHDQNRNAFAYARTGAALVIEEGNLTDQILLNEIDHLMQNTKELASMREAAGTFARPNAASIIAQELLDLGLKHEK